ncbi:flagellar assembly protein FliH [Legionella saoudiensis]|uniref:flagellar assembly protein FliH n=1 Tax=Legionella saoudiensis TaxID=1750561 RepID=UPI0007306F07|nr:flagellar assembly protein FliH [Legionella saoudiensis]
MANKFEPYHTKQTNDNDFSVWDYQSTQKKEEEAPAVDEREVFRAECERLKQEAIKKGYEQGLQQAQAEIDKKKEELIRWLDLVKNPVKLLDEHVIQETLQTILWLSQHCIAVELSVNPEKLRDLLNEIKTELPTLNNHRMLAMHPSDVEWLKAEITENEFPGLHEILAADPTLNRGDFYLKGEHSELDGRIHTRFATLFSKYITKDNLMPMKVQD